MTASLPPFSLEAPFSPSTIAKGPLQSRTHPVDDITAQNTAQSSGCKSGAALLGEGRRGFFAPAPPPQRGLPNLAPVQSETARRGVSSNVCDESVDGEWDSLFGDGFDGLGLKRKREESGDGDQDGVSLSWDHGSQVLCSPVGSSHR